MKHTFIIKNKLNPVSTNKSILERAQKSLNEDAMQIYRATGIDYERLVKFDGIRGCVMLISHVGNAGLDTDHPDESQIKSIYIGEADIHLDSEREKMMDICYRMRRYITSKQMITNILDDLELELNVDYEHKSYVLVSHSAGLQKALYDLMSEPSVPDVKSNYQQESPNYVLHDLAQHNEQCIRLYGRSDSEIQIIGTDGGQLPNISNEFQSDRERIVNSKAFRRLVDKAQIFSTEKGDHYRTRMTHTLEVNQIAKAIAYALRLNLDLTEAIALAHDIGHTPFGHQGERTLYRILSQETSAEIFHIDQHLWKSKEGLLLGGFKHNYQGVRVLSHIEEQYVECPGLDLSVQTLEGVLKHTGLRNAQIKEFAEPELIKYLHLELEEDGEPFASTLEGQVVSIADEIAQRGHDIDDAISSGLITVDELISALSIEKFKPLRELIEFEKDKIEKNHRLVADEKGLLTARMIAVIVKYFINDVVTFSKTQIAQYTADSQVIKQCLVKLSSDGTKTCEFLKKVVNKRVITNAEVARFDYNGGVVIQKLFDTYYQNPKLLHRGTLRKIYMDQLNCRHACVSENALDWTNGNAEEIRKEIEKIHNMYISDLDNLQQLEYYYKKKILIRNIVDYISGMTDSYACGEFEKMR